MKQHNTHNRECGSGDLTKVCNAVLFSSATLHSPARITIRNREGAESTSFDSLSSFLLSPLSLISSYAFAVYNASRRRSLSTSTISSHVLKRDVILVAMNSGKLLARRAAATPCLKRNIHSTSLLCRRQSTFNSPGQTFNKYVTLSILWNRLADASFFLLRPTFTCK